MAKKPRSSRKEQILQSLAQMLESDPNGRVTTAKLAKAVGVSEAALYRHFPSKAKMFESLIIFVEEAIFSRINQITSSNIDAKKQCERVLTLLLTFSAKNPGISRILTGDAIAGEAPRLKHRVVQFFNRIETQIKQIIREAELKEGLRPSVSTPATANLMMVVVEGKIAQFVRSDFVLKPIDNWEEQWAALSQNLFRQ